MKIIGKSRVKIKMPILAMVTGLFLSASLSAQEQNNRPGGLFGIEKIFERPERGLMNRDDISEDLNNQAFGQEVPIGSELLILLGAATGYLIIKKKED